MKDASTRVLLDRTVIRLDGRPFFSFGPRIFLTPLEKIPRAIKDIADAGFTITATPPASRANLAILNAIFDEAERNNLLVVLFADQRLHDLSVFLANNFRHRTSLHSYCIETPDDSAESLAWFCQERDRLRTQDLFHPIWTPYKDGYPTLRWLESVDVQSAVQGTGGPFPRQQEENGPAHLEHITSECARHMLPGRPLFCHHFQSSLQDRARKEGLYSFDPFVRQFPDEIEQWYPYATNLSELPRSDFLPPDADLLRLRLFELLSCRVRGVIMDYYDFFCGESPFTGRDRFAELGLAAQEIAVCHDFFAEGQREQFEVVTGHPLYHGSIIRHSSDFLLLVWYSGAGDEFWIDPAPVSWLGIQVQTAPGSKLKAWQVDFPEVSPLQLETDAKGAIRVRLDKPLLTAKILLSNSEKRAEEMAAAQNNRLPKAAFLAIKAITMRLEKAAYVESELSKQGIENYLQAINSELSEAAARADSMLEREEFSASMKEAAELSIRLRGLINRQMVAALRQSPPAASQHLQLLRQSYYTLPQYYRLLGDLEETGVADYT